jgi:hypothetical protein
MFRQIVLIVSVLLVALLAACSQPAPEPTQAPAAAEPTAAPASPDSYPAPTERPAGYPAPLPNNPYPGPGYPAPDDDLEVSMDPIVVPAPVSNSVGVVTGSVLRGVPGGTTSPLAFGVLYLGEVIRDEGGAEAMVALDKTVAPRSLFNGLGQFLFTDVPPGRYGLMLDLFQGTVLLNDPDDNGQLIIEVVGGDTIDLGELVYPLPER